MLVDTHCHLYLSHFKDDINQVIQHALDNEVMNIILPGIDLITSLDAIQLAEKFSCMYVAVGVHPHSASSWNEKTYYELLGLSKHPKVVAIGEIGLDYYRNSSPREDQLNVFVEQLKLANEVNKPIIIHNRDAFPDVWKLLINSPFHKSNNFPENRGVFHSFSESVEIAELVTKNGYKVGITGPVTYKSAVDLLIVAKSIPITDLLLETDAPYLPPQPYRGKRNEPAYLREIAYKVSSLKDLSYNEIAYHTCDNAIRLFGLGALI